MPDAVDKPLAICLMGPTACGKTDLAMTLADHFRPQQVRLISVDSAQVYRSMDIGTGKPDPKLLKQYPHALIDIRDPAHPYSASDFRADVLVEISMATAAGKIPLLVGGSMLYFKALRDGLANLPSANPALRARIVKLAEKSGWRAVHACLQEVDPETAAHIHPHDPQRLQRALEVYLLTGRPLSDHHQQEQAVSASGLPAAPCRLAWFAIQPSNRTALHGRIASRFHDMLRCGLIEEVRALYRRDDLSPELPSIKAAGYRQIWQYLAGESNYDQMVERSIIATRQLAKRQLTWLRSWPNLHTLGDSSVDSIRRILNSIESSAI